MAATTTSTEPSAATTALPAPAWPWLAALQLCLAAGLAFAWWTQRPEPVEDTPPVALDRVALLHAGSVLQARLAEREADLTSALFPARERTASDFAALQVQAAELTLRELSWTRLPPNGAVAPVELELHVNGSFYNLPILVDGLYRQAPAVELTWIEVESPRLMVAHTDARLRLRFHRPAPLSGSWLEQEADAMGLADVAAGGAALEAAAQLTVYDAFEAATATLEAQSSANRSAVMTALPGVLRKLPTSALGWVGMEADGAVVTVLNEPRD